MKILTLDNSDYLTYIPDVSGLQNLERFSFEYGRNLITIDNSIGKLNKLEILNAKYCCMLESFPPLQLPSLKELELSECWRLRSFPELLCKMTNIKRILLYRTFIEELPFSFGNLSELGCLTISSYNFKILSECLSECHHLRKLVLDDCEYLDEIRGFPPNLAKFSAVGCVSLSLESRRRLFNQV